MNYVDTPKNINCVEWFFGYGGNHLGLGRAITNMRLVAACEIEAYANANLVAKMEQGLLESAPIWSDCKTFPTEPFRDRVDLFIASYPCQGFSNAGLRLGSADPRYLWPHVRNFVRRVRPRYCFFENVAGHVSLGLSTVLSDLEEDGYTTASGLFSAEEVGASHQRQRVFILAKLDDAKHLRLVEHVPEPATEPYRDRTENRLPGASGNGMAGWVRVVFAHECGKCEACGEPFCPQCETHYADCRCPGPNQEDEFEYREWDGVLFARPMADTDRLREPQRQGDVTTFGERAGNFGGTVAESDNGRKCGVEGRKCSTSGTQIIQREIGQPNSDELGNRSALMADASGAGCEGRQFSSTLPRNGGGGAESTWINSPTL